MGANIRMPNITGLSEAEQLKQIKSYLYQLGEELQWAFDNASSIPGSSSVGGSSVTVSLPGANNGIGNQSGITEQNFNAIKSLIIKSADIVNAYYSEISRRLKSVYVAQSDFGTYVQETSQTIEENADSVTRRFENLQAVVNESVGDLGDDIANTRASLEDAKSLWDGGLDVIELEMAGLRAMITDVTGYIKSGLIYYTEDGVPVYGVEIGQSVDTNNGNIYNRFARFTSNKLSFFDSNGIEVAYISDKKLYIGQAEITVSLKQGGLISIVLQETGDIVEKWIGVDG